MKSLVRKLLKSNKFLYNSVGGFYHYSINTYEHIDLAVRCPGVRIFNLSKAEIADLRVQGFKSQYGHEYILLSNHLIKDKDGFFVEFGGSHPVSNSNTWYLEKKLGYRGLSVDALPFEKEWAAKRPASTFVRAFVTQETGEEITFASVAAGNLGFDEYMLSGKVDRIAQSGRNVSYTTTKVYGVSARDILKANGVTKCDVAFFDVEGSELAVLKSIDWDAFSCPVLCVENSWEVDSATRSTVRQFCKSKGYRLWGGSPSLTTSTSRRHAQAAERRGATFRHRYRAACTGVCRANGGSRGLPTC